MIVRVGFANEGEARQRRDMLRAGLQVRKNRGRRRQGPRYGQAAEAAIIDADFALRPVVGRRLVRNGVMTENAARLCKGSGGNLATGKTRPSRCLPCRSAEAEPWCSPRKRAFGHDPEN
jgi:hypothetical protein